MIICGYEIRMIILRCEEFFPPRILPSRWVIVFVSIRYVEEKKQQFSINNTVINLLPLWSAFSWSFSWNEQKSILPSSCYWTINNKFKFRPERCNGIIMKAGIPTILLLRGFTILPSVVPVCYWFRRIEMTIVISHPSIYSWYKCILQRWVVIHA